jgi:Caspase domain
MLTRLRLVLDFAKVLQKLELSAIFRALPLTIGFLLFIPNSGLRASILRERVQRPANSILSGSNLAQKERRNALVIGNAAYSANDKLTNPTNDADDIARELKGLGFEVTLLKDVGQQEMEDAIEKFNRQLRQGGVGLFFYSGHGVQVSGQNYLIPIGAKINREQDIRLRTVPVEQVLGAMEEAGNPVNIVILDACRDNPFIRRFTKSANRGLANLQKEPEGMLVAFATSAGDVAKDGDGRNSPYTASLLQYIREAELPLSLLFEKVGQSVKDKTGNQQKPRYQSYGIGQYSFKTSGTSSIVPPNPRLPNIPWDMKWSQGLPNNSYNLSNNSIEITAAPGTDAFPNTEPRMLKVVRGDYEATVKVNFSCNENYQRATLGIREMGKGSGIIRLYMLEKKRIEVVSSPDSNASFESSNIQVYPSDSVYFKIKNRGNELLASYSEDNNSWTPFLRAKRRSNSQEMEVFLSVLSTDLNKICSASFSEFSILK